MYVVGIQELFLIKNELHNTIVQYLRDSQPTLNFNPLNGATKFTIFVVSKRLLLIIFIRICSCFLQCIISTLISLINVKSRLPILKNSTIHKKKSTLHVYWFLRFFPPSTPHFLELCTSFFQKIPPSTFIRTSTFSDLATFVPPL